MKKSCPVILLVLSFCVLPCLTADGQVPLSGQESANPPSPAETALMTKINRWAAKANERLEKNDMAGARQAAETALQIAGNHRSEIADALAPIYLRSGQYARAASLFDQHNNPSRNLSANEAIALIGMHRFAQARKCYRESQLLRLHGDSKPYLPGIASDKNFAAAIFLWRGVADVDSNHPVNGAWALHQAVQLVPRNPLALCYYADALAATAHAQEAKHFYRFAIKQDHGIIVKRAEAGLARLPQTSNTSPPTES